MFATIVSSFCADPVNVETSTLQSIKEAQPQKRHIGLSALSDCDGPAGVVGLHGGLHSDVAVHGDLDLGLHGHGYAPGYAGGYAGGYSSGYSSGYLSSGSYGHVGSVSSYGGLGLGGLVSSPHVISGGYAPHAPILASSIVSHAPIAVAAPAV